jgi:hypothetical protein
MKNEIKFTLTVLSSSGGSRVGSVWNPRNDNPRGSDFGFQNQKNPGNQGGRGHFPGPNKQQGGGGSNQFNNFGAGRSNNKGSNFQQKSKPPNKGFRGGGN